jgi:hypothetical protein
MGITLDSILQSQDFISEKDNSTRSSVELWVQYVPESDKVTVTEFVVRTKSETHLWAKGKFTTTVTHSVAAFEHKANAVEDYNNELKSLGDPQFDAHKVLICE